MLYIKDCISDGVKIVRNHHDSVILLKLDRNVFNIEIDIYIAGVYIWGERTSMLKACIFLKSVTKWGGFFKV